MPSEFALSRVGCGNVLWELHTLWAAILASDMPLVKLVHVIPCARTEWPLFDSVESEYAGSRARNVNFKPLLGERHFAYWVWAISGETGREADEISFHQHLVFFAIEFR